MPRCSRPIASGSHASSAYCEMSRPNASSPGQAFMQSLTRKPLAQPTSSTRSPALRSKWRDHVLGDRNPAAVVAIAAVALRAIAVEILATELHGDVTLLDLLGMAGGDVALRARIAVQQVDFGHQTVAFSAVAAARVASRPTRGGVNWKSGNAARRRETSN